MNNKPSLQAAPAPVASQVSSAGAPFYMRRDIFRRLKAALPEARHDLIYHSFVTTYQFVRQHVPVGSINRDIERIVRVAITRGVDARELAKQFVAVVSSITPLSSDRKEAKAD